ncbi:hypothetical protein LZ634_10110 [Kluyvera intermedia]|uniref:hypothetical protein n=1 Tax=Kluyvera intermedia TaxID=61648 RepID=UPI001F1A8FC3|nr:hypothetical protein [Kluyvera intermedia]MCE9889052.1 hypothetical protein [Kluyvera intermedia]
MDTPLTVAVTGWEACMLVTDTLIVLLVEVEILLASMLATAVTVPGLAAAMFCTEDTIQIPAVQQTRNRCSESVSVTLAVFRAQEKRYIP